LIFQKQCSLLNKGKFHETDFYDIKEPISVVFSVKYNEDELGFFENNFDIDDEFSITIRATQENIYERIEYRHASSANSFINPKTIKKMNFIYYSSLRNPNKELNFSRNIGTGKVLNYLIEHSLDVMDIEDFDLIHMDNVEEVVESLNEKLKKLNGLSVETIETFVSDDKQNIINRILEVGDASGRGFESLGDGLQYSFNIFLYILQLLIKLKTYKEEEEFESLTISTSNEEKLLPILIALDEPEIHQHPYRQRALIKSIKKIINNENEEFIEILNELFGIDGLIGQVFIATHSPNILLNDYKQIIRLFSDEDNITISSGENIDFNDKVHKHLMRSFIYVKEAMFSKKVILVEGDTEYGALPEFIRKLGFDSDYQGIGIIKLDGADSIIRCMELYKKFNIDTFAIIDRDKKEKYDNYEDIFFTEYDDFEAEIYNCFEFDNYMGFQKENDSLEHFIKYLKSEIDDFLPKEFLKNPVDYEIQKEIKRKIMNENAEEEIKDLRKNKNALNGAILAKYVNEVPRVFKEVILELVGENKYD